MFTILVKYFYDENNHFDFEICVFVLKNKVIVIEKFFLTILFLTLKE